MIKIDENRLISDLYYTRNEFKSGRYKDIIKSNYSDFFLLNRVLANTIGKMINEKNMFRDKKEVEDMMNKRSIFHLNKFAELGEENGKYYFKMFQSLDNILNESNFKSLPYYDTVRFYSEKDFKDIILSFFNEYGDNYYKIAKKYFDEERILLGYTTSHNKENMAGFFANLTWIYAGYIVSRYQTYDSFSLCSIVHELGHAIDAEIFLFPQQKVIPVMSDMYIEIPSTVFEMSMFDYLNKNKIDYDGSLILLNDRLAMLQSLNEEYTKILNTDNLYLNEEGNLNHYTKELIKKEDAIIDEDNNVLIENQGEKDRRAQITSDGDVIINRKFEYQYRDTLLYGLGYYMALHLNLIKDYDIQEFNKVLNNIITLRKESNFEQIIDLMGISLEDFLEGKYIKNKINNHVLELNKRFNINY